MNPFLKYPEFIQHDPRLDRGQTYGFAKLNKELHYDNPVNIGGYDINFDVQYHRHNIALPPELLKNKSVLDLGCCIGASGAWALSNGAKKYVGVEYIKSFAEEAEKNLSKYFAQSDWTIYETSLETFFKFNVEQFDIVLAWGIAFVSSNVDKFVDDILAHCRQDLIIDAGVPRHLADLNHDDIPVFGLYNSSGQTVGEPSFGYMKELLQQKNFIVSNNHTATLRSLTEPNYNYRWCASFTRMQIQSNINYSSIWNFDNITKNFVEHAEKHIPNYHLVITKCIRICQRVFGLNKDIKIVDIGCATGETLLTFAGAGYKNLVGVDSNPRMLAQARHYIEKHYHIEYVQSAEFPGGYGPFDVVLCNWTLHFIPNKLQYLQYVYQSMNPGGVLIITDKTENDGVDLEMYHAFKRSKLVSDSEIVAKQQSVKNIMYINNPEWYLSHLRSLGFSKVSIIDADFCFTTFLAIR